MKRIVLFLGILACLISCRYHPAGATKETASIIKKNTNLELYADSVSLELLPVKDTYITLYKGTHVVAAEFDIHPQDSIDSVWVKVAHSQEAQGWIRQSELISSFVPVDSISHFIYLFSHTHLSYFIVVIALFVGVYLFRASRQKQIYLVYFNDIDSIYPLLLCLLMAVSATLYESIQIFTPLAWQCYFFDPTLSPFKVPLLLSAFLVSIWSILIVALAALDDVFGQLSPSAALLYVLGLLSACIFCYFFFIWTTPFFVGYLFLVAFIQLFIRKAKSATKYNYRCGKCGRKIISKGICPHCGTINK